MLGLYFFLHSFLFVVCIYYGWRISSQKNISYWKLAWVPLVTFVLIEGLRFGRGIDYNLYFNVYDDISKGFTQGVNHEFLFIWICRVLSFLGLPYQGFILFCSGLLIFSGLSFLKNHRQTMMYSLPLFVYSTLLAENLIRWFLGFSIMLWGIYFLNKKERKKSLIFFIIGVCLHNGLIVVVLIYYLISRLKKPLLPPTASIIIYLLLYCIWNNSYMIVLQEYANLLFSNVERFGSYLDNSKEWLTGSNKEEKVLNILTYVRYIATHIFLIIAGYKVVQKEKNLLYYYNILLVGIIFFPAFNGIELFYRINQLLLVFQFIIGGYCFCYVFSTKKMNILRVFAYVVLLFYMYNIIRIGLNPKAEQILYIWDAKGRDYLPIDIYL